MRKGNWNNLKQMIPTGLFQHKIRTEKKQEGKPTGMNQKLNYYHANLTFKHTRLIDDTYSIDYTNYNI